VKEALYDSRVFTMKEPVKIFLQTAQKGTTRRRQKAKVVM